MFICTDCKHLKNLDIDLRRLPTIKTLATERLQNLKVASVSMDRTSFEEIKELLYSTDEVELASFNGNSFNFSLCIFRKLQLHSCTFSLDTMLTLPATVKNIQMWDCNVTDVCTTSGVNTNTPCVESLTIVDSEVPVASFLNLSSCRTLKVKLSKDHMLRTKLDLFPEVVRTAVNLNQTDLNIRGYDDEVDIERLLGWVCQKSFLESLSLRLSADVLFTKEMLKLLKQLTSLRYLEIVSDFGLIT